MLTDEQVGLLHNLKVDLHLAGRAEESEAVRQVLEDISDVPEQSDSTEIAQPELYAYWVVYVYREVHGRGWIQFTDSIGFEYPVLISTNNHLYRLGEYIHREFRKSATMVRVISATLMPGGQS